MKRIVVIEDNHDIAYGLRNNLEIEGYEVEIAEDGESGLETVRGLEPDLVILDLMLPGLDGFRVLRALRTEGGTTPVLVLTARGEESDKVRGLKLGADDYVTKPFGLLELLARVEALLRRSARLQDQSSVRIGELEIERGTRTVRLRGRAVDLAPKEYDLLIALVDRSGSIVPRHVLMREVWGYSDEAVTRTLDTHIAALRRKLEDDSSGSAMIITVRKVGYRMAMPPDSRKS